ncbi:unnamed protein product [Arctia plantaginis]|uniref:Uncharacterized protein n=1 Tax=Arctia plantaginis TaxID=874455 RepID=A0A8S1BLH7_ARCPL|nr:unnamed protein product [Arctia plantaginis]
MKAYEEVKALINQQYQKFLHKTANPIEQGKTPYEAAWDAPQPERKKQRRSQDSDGDEEQKGRNGRLPVDSRCSSLLGKLHPGGSGGRSGWRAVVPPLAADVSTQCPHISGHRASAYSI